MAQKINTYQELLLALGSGKKLTEYDWDEDEFVQLVGNELRAEDGEIQITLEEFFEHFDNGEDIFLYEDKKELMGIEKSEYVKNQLANLSPASEYFGIKITDNDGDSTNVIKMDKSTLEVINDFFKDKFNE